MPNIRTSIFKWNPVFLCRRKNDFTVVLCLIQLNRSTEHPFIRYLISKIRHFLAILISTLTGNFLFYKLLWTDFGNRCFKKY